MSAERGYSRAIPEADDGATMELRFINHAGLIVSHGDVRLFEDPWLDGRVFNNGWQLISRTRFPYEAFADITHLWFSHEHPDHFNPPTLARIAPEHRARITVLFQRTRDGRVVKACRKLGFKSVIEIDPAGWLPIGDGVDVMCERYEEGDSWLAVRSAGGQTVLNTNDCGIRDPGRAREILRRVGPIDVLLSQFSYAYWAGNPEDTELRRHVAEEKLLGLARQCEWFRPRQVVPIASFAWFCHEENFFLNDAINTPRRTFEYLRAHGAGAEPVVLYPDDVLVPGRSQSSEDALSRYQVDYEQVRHPTALLKSTPVTRDTLLAEARAYVEKLRRSPWARLLLRPAHVYLWDLQRGYRLDLRGMTETDRLERDCDAALSAESLLYCFRFAWGQDTLAVSGRLHKPRGAKRYVLFYNYFRFEQLRSRGVEVNARYLSGTLLRHVGARLRLARANTLQ